MGGAWRRRRLGREACGRPCGHRVIPLARRRGVKTIRSMDAIKILEGQHREVEQLFKAFSETKDVPKRAEIFDALADRLAAHTQIEEQVFYPESETEETEEQLRESLEEHLAAKRVLAD